MTPRSCTTAVFSNSLYVRIREVSMKQTFICLIICAVLTETGHAGRQQCLSEMSAADRMQAAQSADDHKIDKAVLNFLGCDRIRIILDSEKMESYRIDWRGVSDKDTPTVEGYPVISRGREADPGHIFSIRKMICMSESYEFQWAKRTRVRPSYLLRFLQGRETVSVAIDFDSSQWAFHHKGDIVEEDINSRISKPVLSEIIRYLFGDRELVPQKKGE